jgi:ubiquinone/menaquinone biosynthesis C-methylase UbiE
METEVEKWLKEYGEVFLKEIGIKKGQTVLDFGCGVGHYTIPAAKIAGKEGKVYAVDKERKILGELREIANREALENTEPIETRGALEIPEVKGSSIDVALLYDVIHLVSDRDKLYKEIYRILTAGGILSVYPKHSKLDHPGWGLENMSLEDIIEEVEKANFYLEKKFFKELLHDKSLTKGHILNFGKQAEKC